MKRLHFTQDIHASAQNVYESMLGLHDKASYQYWTAVFNPSSTYEGSWDQGSKIQFIGQDEAGNPGGMASEIIAHRPNEYVAIRYYGFVNGDQIITTGEQAEKFAGSQEIYSFKEQNGITTVTVELDSIAEYVEYFNQQYPKALALLQAYCEG